MSLKILGCAGFYSIAEEAASREVAFGVLPESDLLAVNLEQDQRSYTGFKPIPNPFFEVKLPEMSIGIGRRGESIILMAINLSNV